jgi:hypothetical protein
MTVAKLINKGKSQRLQHVEPLLKQTKKELASVQAIVRGRVNGKYQALREAQLEVSIYLSIYLSTQHLSNWIYVAME